MADFIYKGKGIRTVADVQRANQQRNLENDLIYAQIEKKNQLDVDKLGEIGFMKAAMGQPLTPQEEAAARFIDAKSGGIMFNPATGAIQQKPRISEKIGLPGIDVDPQSQIPLPVPRMAKTPQVNQTPYAPKGDSAAGEFERKFQEQMRLASGNPKLQQTIRENYAKAKIDYDESQSKAAGFADRAMSVENVLSDPRISEAGMSLEQRARKSVPMIGNYLVSDEYQKFDQAQRDFVNAILRRESGAVINPDEFENARKQYLPQPGDRSDVLEQKRINRANAIKGLALSAGAGYENNSLYNKSEADFKAKKQKPLGEIKFLGFE